MSFAEPVSAKEEFKKPEFKPREKAKFKGKKKEGEEGESAFAKDGYRDRGTPPGELGRG